jgi:hypothetical protein
MKQVSSVFVAAIWAGILMSPNAALAQHHNLTHDRDDRDDPDDPDDRDAVANATTGFGVAPPATGGAGTTLDSMDPSCLVVGTTYTFPGTPPVRRAALLSDLGGPNDPCSYKNHRLTPEETTILKGGQVRFEAHGGGHSFAIYQVSKDTTRADIGQFLCGGFDRSQPAASHPCETGIGSSGAGALNAAAAHSIAVGKDDVVIVANTNPPDAQVASEPGRLSAASAFANAQFISYRFLKTGRYIVLCLNRTHFLNDWMFGFVNVVGGE